MIMIRKMFKIVYKGITLLKSSKIKVLNLKVFFKNEKYIIIILYKYTPQWVQKLVLSSLRS